DRQRANRPTPPSNRNRRQSQRAGNHRVRRSQPAAGMAITVGQTLHVLRTGMRGPCADRTARDRTIPSNKNETLRGIFLGGSRLSTPPGNGNVLGNGSGGLDQNRLLLKGANALKLLQRVAIRDHSALQLHVVRVLAI